MGGHATRITATDFVTPPELHGYALAGKLAGRDLETAGSTCPAYEVLCHAQSRLYTRLFRS